MFEVESAGQAITVLRNAKVCDGSAADGVHADVWIQGERVLAIQPPGVAPMGLDTDAAARCVVHDCTGLVIAPGFIDVHTHDDAVVLDHPDMIAKLSQGITTVVTGNCGISLIPMVISDPKAPLSLWGTKQFRFDSLPAYREAIDQTQPGVNMAVLIGHTTLRMQVMTDLDKPASPVEIAEMCRILDHAMREGALGMSSGVFYRQAYAASQDELTALVKVVAGYGGVYSTHIRDELRGIVEAIEEAALTARQAGAPLVLSHHKCAGPANWGRTTETLPLIEKLALQQPISMDVYPYTMTGMSASRFGLTGWGRLKPGFFADIVVINPDKIRDQATYADPVQFSDGVEQVWVNGRLSFLGREKRAVARAGAFVSRNGLEGPQTRDTI